MSLTRQKILRKSIHRILHRDFLLAGGLYSPHELQFHVEVFNAVHIRCKIWICSTVSRKDPEERSRMSSETLQRFVFSTQHKIQNSPSFTHPTTYTVQATTSLIWQYTSVNKSNLHQMRTVLGFTFTSKSSKLSSDKPLFLFQVLQLDT
jgi:hypothetical protein